MLYRNKNTGVMLETVSALCGGGWELVEAPAAKAPEEPVKKEAKTAAKEPKKKTKEPKK